MKKYLVLFLIILFFFLAYRNRNRIMIYNELKDMNLEIGFMEFEIENVSLESSGNDPSDYIFSFIINTSEKFTDKIKNTTNPYIVSSKTLETKGIFIPNKNENKILLLKMKDEDLADYTVASYDTISKELYYEKVKL
jgi:hypothetical protein